MCYQLCTSVAIQEMAVVRNGHPEDAPQPLRAEGRRIPALQCVVTCGTHWTYGDARRCAPAADFRCGGAHRGIRPTPARRADCQNGSRKGRTHLAAKQIFKPTPSPRPRVEWYETKGGKAAKKYFPRTNRDKMRQRAVSPRKSALRKRARPGGCQAKGGENQEKRGKTAENDRFFQ
jgi:hypothetical protein